MEASVQSSEWERFVVGFFRRTTQCTTTQPLALLGTMGCAQWGLPLLLLAFLQRGTSNEFMAYDLAPFALTFRTRSDATLSQSSLRLLVSEFLLESFRIELAGASGISEDMRQLVSLNVDVDVEKRPTDQPSDLYYYTTYATTLYLLPPTQEPPSIEDVRSVYQKFWEISLARDFAILRERFRESDDPVLESHWELTVLMNVTLGESPLEDLYTTSNTRPGLWGVFGVATTGFILAFFLIMRRKRSLDTAFLEPPVVLPGRGVDVTEATEASDRWLEQNRPDLLDAIQKASPNNSAREEDDPIHVHQETGWWHKVTSTLAAHRHEPEVENYDFPFRDFPRKDGTPCLIYEENVDGPVVLRKDDRPSVSPSMDPPEPNSIVPLSDADFKRQLSMQSLNSSLDSDGNSVDSDFTNRLERLMVLRHRHFEREQMVMRKKQKEAKDRELLLRRHEMELHLGEIEAQSTPRQRGSEKSPSNRNSSDSNIDGAPSPEGKGLPPLLKPSKDIVKPRRSRQRSHRRTASHSIPPSEKSEHVRSNSTDDVVTFGIAAYSSIV